MRLLLSRARAACTAARAHAQASQALSQHCCRAIEQAARREARHRARGFQIRINLGRINMRAVVQLIFMLVVMAPVGACAHERMGG